MNAQTPAPDEDRRLAILDVGDLRHPDIERRRALGRQLVRASVDVGFFYIVNHGMPQRQMDQMFALGDAFFELPAPERDAVSMMGNEHFCGYLPMKASGDATMNGTLMEAFHAWREAADGEDFRFAGKVMNGANVWPAGLPDMQGQVGRYVQAVSALTCDLLKVAALGLALPEATFLRYFHAPLSLLRLIHYPPQSPSQEAEGRFGIRPHTDHCALTLLLQDDKGGLQILGRERQWIDVAPVPGSFVINLGETMKVWTNGLFKATPHRVINRSGKERRSIAFFMNPDDGARIVPLMTETPGGAVEPVFHSTVSIGDDATAGETLHRLYTRIYPTASSNHTAPY